MSSGVACVIGTGASVGERLESEHGGEGDDDEEGGGETTGVHW
jgi:hypothetical protein